ncbi:creatininase family protein [Streptomyces sp. NPDC002514]|uniref:creatininase family protein n=1 Tax=unclassified Streptomyces TaxID=2593676 RepID=UPI0036A90DA4
MTTAQQGFLWAEQTTEDIADLAGDGAVAVQPIGAVEQHGPHLPLVTDALIAECFAHGAVRGLGAGAGVWVLPTLSYGKSTEHLGRAGTIALSTATLQAVCMDLGASLAASGVHKLVFVNGHGGQPSLLDVVARDIRHAYGLQVFSVMPARFPLPDGVTDPDPFGIHGGFVETSLMLALAPHLVHLDEAVADGLELGELYRARRHLTLEGVVPTAWLIDDVSASGVVGDPAGASAGTGERLVADWTARLAEALTEVRAFSFPPVRRREGAAR